MDDVDAAAACFFFAIPLAAGVAGFLFRILFRRVITRDERDRLRLRGSDEGYCSGGGGGGEWLYKTQLRIASAVTAESPKNRHAKQKHQRREKLHLSGGYVHSEEIYGERKGKNETDGGEAW
jgi:hypothetical protein